MNGKINIDDLLKVAFEDFEVQPSPEMLDNILGDNFDASLQSAFDNFISTPPVHIWESINESIPTEADKAFSTSFDEFKVTPPTHLWENISDSIPSEVDTLMNASFNEFEVTPPANMWASIQSELDVEEHFDTKFQEAFSGFAPTPSEHILSNVLSNKFDTGVRRAFMRHEIEPREAVWDRIKPYIRFSPVIQRHLPTVRRMAAVVLCLLLCTFLYKQIDISGSDTIVNIDRPSKVNTTTKHTSQIPTQNEAEQPSESVLEKAFTERIVSVEKQPVTREATGQSGEIDQMISQSSSVGSGSSRFSNGSSLPPVSSGSNEAVLLSPTFTTTTPTKNEHTDNLISSISNVNISELETYTPKTFASEPDWNDLELSETSAFGGFLSNDYAIQSNFIDTEEDSDLAKMMLNYKGLYISSSFMASTSWILNEVVRERLSDPDRGLMNYAATTGNLFGLGVGYQLTTNFGIEAQIQKSRLSQNYRGQTALNAYSSKRAVYANYLYIPISFKYQIGRASSMNKRVPRTFSTVWGVHYGRLQNVDIRIDNPGLIPGTEDYFIQQELGVFTGIDYHFYISPNVHLTAGFRAAAGTDFEYLSAPFAAGTPYNIQVGGCLGLNYRFATRKYKWNNGIY